MVPIDELARAAFACDALALRSLTQDWLSRDEAISQCPPPESDEPTLRAIAAGIVELLAERRHEAAPSWARQTKAAPHPVYLLKSALTMRRLRELCENESPPPLRKRMLFAPPNFLEFA